MTHDHPSDLRRLHREEHEAAARRVQERILFYEHFTWFFWLNLLFLILNVALTPDSRWCFYVALFWGAGLLIHLVAALFVADLRGPYHRRALQDELRRTNRRFL